MENGLARGVNLGTDIGVFGGDETGILDGLAQGVYNENRLYLENLNLPIIRDGLVLYLDAGNPYSYSGSGTGITWRDMSGGNRNFILSGPVWDSANGGRFFFDGTNDVATGPASNTFGFSYDVTIEVILNPTEYVNGSTFTFFIDDAYLQRGYHAHTPYGNSYYWDVFYQRNIYTDSGETFKNKIGHFVFRARGNPTPRRQILRNNVSLVDSGADANDPALVFNSTPAVLGARPSLNEWFKGYIYIFRVYNRALSDNEITQNYNATKSRFNL